MSGGGGNVPMFTFHKRGKVSAAEFLELLPSPLPGEKIERAKFKFSPHADVATLSSKLPANLREAALLLHPHCGPGTHLLFGADRVQLSWAPCAAGPDAAALDAAYDAALRRVASCAPAPAAHAAAAPLEVLLDWVSPAESKAWARTVGQNGGSQLKEFKMRWGAEVAPAARGPGKLRVVGSRAAVDAAVEGLIKWRDDVLAPFYNPALSKVIPNVCVATAPSPAQAQARAQAQATPFAPTAAYADYPYPRTPSAARAFT
jgi:hypothetical protein